ncbi:EamA family transporter [Spongisporangium articulatum]|uniref:EamA family transporter n=1 Tax=Spongisporangium articulatum TaxID=3362603 RepID=A0ABW8AR74_9ACTN
MNPQALAGLWIALTSAAAFGFSGPMAKAMLEAGWSPGATVLVRIGAAALVLAVPAVRQLRSRPRMSPAALRTLVLFGAFAVAGVQLAFFNAVQTLDVGVALLLEYLGTVLVVGYVWARTRKRPSAAVGLGVALSLAGLVFVLDLTGATMPDPVGVGWGLLAAVGLAAYFVIGGQADDDLPPFVLAAGGLGVGAVTLGLAGLVGAVDLTFTTHRTTLAGWGVPWWLPLTILVLVPTVLAYVTGVAASGRLGARLASVTGLTEVLFAVLASWALLDQWPGPMQLIGGVLIVAGVVVIRRYESSEQAHPESLGGMLVEGDRLGAPGLASQQVNDRVGEVRA